MSGVCPASTFLTLNVGGQQFTTSKQTLLQEPSSRLGLLACGALRPVDESGIIRVDRDPTHFGKVLNYLRDGYCVVAPADRKELMQEARFYQLAGMEAWLRSQGAAIAASTHASTMLAAKQHAGAPPSSAAAGAAPSPAPQTPPASARDMARQLLRSPAPAGTPAPVPTDVDGSKWTAKYTQGSPQLAQAVATVLQLAQLAPHASLHRGRVTVTLSATCEHAPGQLAGSGPSPPTVQVLQVKASAGWSFDLALRPGSDPDLRLRLASLPEVLQDNWFVVAAVLRDQHGRAAELDGSCRPGCAACRRATMTLHLTWLEQ